MSAKNQNLFNSSLALAMASVILGMYGFRFRFEHDMQSMIFFARILSILFIFSIVLTICFLFKNRAEPYPQKVSSYQFLNIDIKEWLTAVVIMVLFSQTIFLNSKVLLPLSWWVITSLVNVLVLLAALRNKLKWAVILLFVFIIFIVIKYMAQVPIAEGSLILSQISDACNVILEGENPYLGGTRMHFMYLPGLMAPYILSFTAKIDLRFVNLISFLILGFFVLKLAWKSKQAPISAIVAAGVILLSAKNIQMVTEGHLPFYWLLVFSSFYLISMRRFYLSSVLIGIAAATRQETIILLLPVAVYFLRQIGPRKSIQCALFSIGVYFLFVLPVWAVMGNSFWYYAYLKIVKGFEVYFSGMGVPFNQISISGFLYGILGKKALVLIQVGLIFFAAVFTWLKAYKSPVRFTALCGFLIVLFVSLNLLVQWYYYTTGLILISMSLLSMPKEDMEVPHARG